MTGISKSRGGGGVRWTEAEAEAAGYQTRLEGSQKAEDAPAPVSLADALTAMGLGGRVHPVRTRGRGRPAEEEAGTVLVEEKKARKRKETTPAGGGDGRGAAEVPVERKKRRGVNTLPIFQSLINTPAHSAWGEDWLAIELPGGRVLTYNELFSILQFRKHESFRYKKVCRKAISRALLASSTHRIHRPFFDGPTRWTVVRIGAKDMDRDALSIIFKYFLDALKTQGVIADDNPNIIVDIQTIQDVGPPRLAMMLKKVPNWKDTQAPSWDNWMREHREGSENRKPC